MVLIDSIESIPEWESKTAQQVLDALNEATIPYIDTQMWTWAGVALVAGPQGAEGLRMALEANGMGWAVHQLGGSGLQLSADAVQPVLYAFGQAGVPGMTTLAQAVKRSISKAESDGLGLVTLEQVKAALSSLQRNAWRQSKKQIALDRYSTYATAIDTYDGTGEEPVL